MLHRLVFVCALLVLGAIPASVDAQSGTYDLHWVAVCGPNVFNQNQNEVSVQRGELRIIVERVEDSPPFWMARDASTGAEVWSYAIDGGFAPDGTYFPGQVQEMLLPASCAGSWFGSFEWNPGGTEDRSLTFHIYDGWPGSSRESGRLHAVGIRAAAQSVTPTVTITAPTAGQVVSGTTPIRLTTSGFTTGSRTWVLLVDGAQRQTNTTTSDSFVIWFNTTRVVNGTHTFIVRVTQGSRTVEASVSVTVRN